MEPTEREKKLLGYILHLFALLNIYGKAVHYIYDIFPWIQENVSGIKNGEVEPEMVEYINTEFGVNIKLTDYENYDERKAKNANPGI